MSAHICTDFTSEPPCNECRQHAEIAALRAENAALKGEVERAWACRDDEVNLRVMEADKRDAAEDAAEKWKQGAIAQNDARTAAEAALESLRGEVRRVLCGVADFGPADLYPEVEWCWCGDPLPIEKHRPYCLAARALLKRVGP